MSPSAIGGQLKVIATANPSASTYAIANPASAVLFRLTWVAERQVRIDGEHKIYGRIADSGFEIRFHFCPNWGSSVFWEGDRGLDHYGIAVGCFADPDFP